MKQQWILPWAFCAILLAACGGSGGSPSTPPAQPARPDPPTPPPNAAPSADAGKDEARTSEQAVTLNGSNSGDPEGGALRYSWTQQTGQPQVTLQDANAANATFTAPTVTRETVLTFTLTVTDPEGQTADDTVQITILPPNAPPSVEAIEDDQASSGQTVTLSGSGNGPEDGPLHYSWTQQTGQPQVTLHDANAAHATFTAPIVTEETVLTFTLTITDPNGQTTDYMVQITISPPDAPPSPPNAPPSADAGEDDRASPGQVVTLNGSGSDPENGTLRYSWTQPTEQPQATLRDANAARATFAAPTVTEEMVLTFTLTVTDPEGQTTYDTVQITILPPNAPPSADAGEDGQTVSGQVVTLSGGGNDPEGGTLRYSWTQQTEQPQATLQDANAARTTFTAPIVTEDTVLTFTLTVTDPEGQPTYDTVRITISNAPPSAEAGDDGKVFSGQTVILAGSGHDPEGGALRYSWTQQTGQPQVTLGNANAARTTFTATTVTEDTVLTFTLTVTDLEDQSTQDTVQIIILPPNAPPSAEAGDGDKVSFGQVVTLDGSGTDPEGRMLDYSWTQQTGQQQVTLQDATAAQTTFTAPTVTEDTVLTFTLTVTDPEDQSTQDTVQFTISPLSVEAGADPLSVTEGTVVTLNATAGSTVPGNLSYLWIQWVGGSRVAIAGADQAQATFTAPGVGQPTNMVFILGVSDDRGHEMTDVVTITVSPSSATGYQAGLFKPSRNFRNRCENPRVGINSYPDMRGTAEDEKNFLRSYTNENYLWYDEVVDIDPGDEAYTTAEYFEQMKTFATTPSGKDKDEHHFTWDTADWIAYNESGSAAGQSYGFSLVLVRGEVTLRYAHPDSPAGRSGLSRGARILTIEGHAYVPGSPVGPFLYPDGTVSEYEFVVRDLGSETTRTFRMQAGGVTIDPVRHVRVIETDSGDVGYLLFTNFIGPSEVQLIEAFKGFAAAGVTDLVLDMRYNGGGLGRLARQLGTMVANPAATSGRIFTRQRFNDKHPLFNPITGRLIDPGYFPTTAYGFSAVPGTPLPTLNLNRVFVLTTDDTCSASENTINGLRGINVEVVLVGTTTCGKPYGFYPTDNCGTTYFSINYQSVNNKGFGDFADGFSPANLPLETTAGVRIPGCAVADDFDHGFGDPDEAKLAAVLQYRIDSTCPTLNRVGLAPVALDPTTPEPMPVGNMIQSADPWNVLF